MTINELWCRLAAAFKLVYARATYSQQRRHLANAKTFCAHCGDSFSRSYGQTCLRGYVFSRSTLILANLAIKLCPLKLETNNRICHAITDSQIPSHGRNLTQITSLSHPLAAIDSLSDKPKITVLPHSGVNFIHRQPP